MRSVEAFIIHLERADERRPNVERLAAEIPLACHVVKACDAALMNEADLHQGYVRDGLHKPHYPFSLNAGEIACFHSHRIVWREIIARDLDAGLILEDDVEMSADFIRAFDFARTSITDGDFIRFAKNTRERPAAPALRDGEILLFRPEQVGLGMLAQLVTRSAAERLLEATERFDRPVDTFLQLDWLHTARVLTVQPVLVKDISQKLGGTTVQTRKRSFFDRITRDVKRLVYRTQINLLSRSHSRS